MMILLLSVFSLRSYFLFRLRRLTTDSEYRVYVNPHTALYRLMRNFAGSFVTVCRFACGFGIIIIFICVTFSAFELRHFWNLNTIKVHYRGHIVCATPQTVNTNQFETLQALYSWSVDVHVVLALSSI